MIIINSGTRRRRNVVMAPGTLRPLAVAHTVLMLTSTTMQGIRTRMSTAAMRTVTLRR